MDRIHARSVAACAFDQEYQAIGRAASGRAIAWHGTPIRGHALTCERGRQERLVRDEVVITKPIKARREAMQRVCGSAWPSETWAIPMQRFLRRNETLVVHATKRILIPQIQTMIASAKVAITSVLSQWALIKIALPFQEKNGKRFSKTATIQTKRHQPQTRARHVSFWDNRLPKAMPIPRSARRISAALMRHASAERSFPYGQIVLRISASRAPPLANCLRLMRSASQR